MVKWNNKKENTFEIDHRMRLPEEVDPARIGLIQRVQNKEGGGAYRFNVLYLASQASGNPSAEDTGDIARLVLFCRAGNPIKVQVQRMTGLDPKVSAWCDYLRIEKRWVAVIPETKPTGSPWDVCLTPIDLEHYSFRENAHPESREGQALDFIFTASGGQIPDSTWLHSLFDYFVK